MLKLVVRHKAGDGVFANAYIISDHYNRSLETFNKLVNVARQDLGKGIEDKDFECAVIIDSCRHKHKPCVRFFVDPSIPTPEGWLEPNNLEFRLA